tara:strand:+ start:446 stop:748 length:303 start_codon:yes stop_codon:yes gene_type:complete
MKLLNKYSNELAQICAKHHVLELSAFGSVVRNELTPESDIDLLVIFNSIALEDYADNYFNLCEELEKLLQRKVDLMVDKAVKNPYFKEELDETKQLLFAA